MSFYYELDNVRKGLISSSSSLYERDWAVEGDREDSRVAQKLSEHDLIGRKGSIGTKKVLDFDAPVREFLQQ
ncbi:hypothetical protein VNO80_23814 [Phaseolus coccineus]|uniref:Uncharacterized protein n=1 Tax=Phaseolus coccineus TaxID=3886 RepID=A0AAN9MCU9_PHACN